MNCVNWRAIERSDKHTPLYTSNDQVRLNHAHLRSSIHPSELEIGNDGDNIYDEKYLGEQFATHDSQKLQYSLSAKAKIFSARVLLTNPFAYGDRRVLSEKDEEDMLVFMGEIKILNLKTEKPQKHPVYYAVSRNEFPFNENVFYQVVFGEIRNTTEADERAAAIIRGFRQQEKDIEARLAKKRGNSHHHSHHHKPIESIAHNSAFTRTGFQL